MAAASAGARYAGDADPYRKPHEDDDDETDETDETGDAHFETPRPSAPQDK